jgi:hypothetical protein
MKRNILLAIAVVFTLSIGAAVYAFNSTTSTTNAAAVSCCCKGDSCPMKSKDAKASADAKESCCKDDCCKGDSCPMKKGDAAKTGTATATAADAKHSCPMMKDGKMAADHHKEMKGMDHQNMNHAEHKNMKHDGEHSCGCGCACCGGSKEKKTETAIL